MLVPVEEANEAETLSPVAAAPSLCAAGAGAAGVLVGLCVGLLMSGGDRGTGRDGAKQRASC